MNFIFNLARREIRSSWRQLLFFFMCIGIGVGSIVALRSLIQNLNRAVASEARFLLTADVEIGSNNDWSEAERRAIEQIERQNAGIIEARGETIQSNTMTRPSDESKAGSQMLDLKGVEAGFPLVGEFRLENGEAFDYRLLENKGALVAPLLLERLNLKVGDSIHIGVADFQIRGVFTEEPGGTAGFRLGPRVIIERRAFDEAGLTGFGSRNRRRILFRTAENPDNLVAQLRAALRTTGSNNAAVRSYKEVQENTKESFDRAENYLSLTGLVILVLGGIGVWNVARVFLEQKKHSIAVLKCLGASGWRILAAYLLQILSLGFLGSLLGVALAQTALRLIELTYGADLPSNLSYRLDSSAVGQGILLGLAVSALFSVLPLLGIKNIKPRLLLRDIGNDAVKQFSILNFLVTAAVIAGMLLLAVWQAGSWRVGTYFLVGLAATAGGLYAAAFVLTKLLRTLRFAPSFAVRQAVGSLYRPGNQTRVVLLGVGLGVFVILAVQSLQSNLVKEFDALRGNAIPNLFMIDIQRQQRDGVREILAGETAEQIEFIPAVRARIAAINERSADDLPATGEIRRERGQLGREYVLTYRPALVGNEQIVAGEFWDAAPSEEPEVSVDESLRGLLGLDVGSRMTFDILGQKITARVTSIRKLDARNPRSTFLIVFRPGSLENAPQTLLLPVMSPLDAGQKARIQRRVVDRFPNVSVIDTGEVVAAVKRLLDNITLAVSFVGAFVFLSGALILIGSIALTKFQRIYENAILKTLGARRGGLLTILLVEYGILGAAAGLVGSLAAVALSYAVANYVLKINWQFEPTLILVGFLATVLLVMIVGAVSSLDVLLRKPLATLRSQ